MVKLESCIVCPKSPKNPMLPVFDTLAEFLVKQSRTATAARESVEKEGRNRKLQQKKETNTPTDESRALTGDGNNPSAAALSQQDDAQDEHRHKRNPSDTTSVASITAHSSEGTLEVLKVPETETQALQDAFIGYLMKRLFRNRLEWVSVRNPERQMYIAYTK